MLNDDYHHEQLIEMIGSHFQLYSQLQYYRIIRIQETFTKKGGRDLVMGEVRFPLTGIEM